MRPLSKLALLAVLVTPSVFALTCGGDTSGNASLKGTYRFRNVMPLNYDNNGNVTEVVAANGTITFNGAGGYSVTGTYVDNVSTSVDAVGTSGKSTTLPTIPTTASGCYAISSNGTGYMANPVLLALTGGSYLLYDYGAVAQGVFTGSMTEAGIDESSGGLALADMFIAMPAGVPTSATFNAPYWTGVVDFTAGLSTRMKSALFKLSPNGSGSLGGLTISGQDAGQNGQDPLTQSSSGGSYSFAGDGTGTLSIAAPSGVATSNALFTGSKTMYVSADGSFVLGWSATGYDMIFGVRAISNASQSTFQGTYFTTALELGVQAFCGGSAGLDAYAGSMLALGTGDAIVDQRLWSPECLTGAYDYNTDEYAELNLDGTSSGVDYGGYNLAFGNGGASFVGVSGSSGFFSLVVGLQAPSFSGTGVYINPGGVFNSGSFSPITAPVSPGELITMYGTGLSTQTLVSGGPFGTSLGGVQVTVNGTLAPMFKVSPNQISFIMPYGLANALTTTGLAQIQVNNGGQLSNVVTLGAIDALPGVFTQSQNGLGYAAALHPDGSVVSPSNPAQPGETLAVYLTGLGTVSPSVTDGSLGPANPLSYVDEYTNGYGQGGFEVFFNDYTNGVFDTAAVGYAGLAPGLSGLYQLNVTVPADVGPGNVYLEVVTYSADANQAQICVSSCGTGAAVPGGTLSPAARTMHPATVGGRARSHPQRITGLGRPKVAPVTK